MPQAAHVTYDDGSREYYYPPNGDRFTSLTTVTGGTEHKAGLVPWAVKLTAQWMLANHDEIAQMRSDGATAEDIVHLAMQESMRLQKVKARAGSFVHAFMETMVLWAIDPALYGDHGGELDLPTLDDDLLDAEYDGLPLTEVVELMNAGFVQFVADWEPEFLASEMTVYDPRLRIAGTLDVIFELADAAVEETCGRLHVVRAPGKKLAITGDGKTGKHLGATTYEQVSGLRRFPEANIGQDVLVPTPTTDYGAILHFRHHYTEPDGYRLRIIPREADTDAYARLTRAIYLFQQRKPYNGTGKLAGQVVRLPQEDGTAAPAWWSDMADEKYHTKIANNLVAAGYRHTAEIAAFTAAQLRAVSGIGAKSVDTIRQILATDGLTLVGETLPVTLEEVA